MIDLHNHTTYSYDGSNTPEEITENAVKHGIKILGISDHQFTDDFDIGVYYSHLLRLKRKYEGVIDLKIGLEIGTRPKPNDLMADMTADFDYVLFECLDQKPAMDFYEFIAWRRCFRCPVGLAHTDVFALSDKCGADVLSVMKTEDIFWELNCSGNYSYYYDMLTCEDKRRKIAESGVTVSVGSDTHWLGEYRFEQLERANRLIESLGNRIIFSGKGRL